MKKQIPWTIITLLLWTVACSAQSTFNKADQKISPHLKWVQHQLKYPNNGKILLAAHRGDWRNTPENSLHSLQLCIEKGYDIIECDLKKSKDGHLIIMHDKSIDRTTTGTGKPEEYTLNELKQFRLRSSTGHATRHVIPTLEEFLAAAKDKAVLCIDKGFEYFNDAMILIKKYHMTSQIIYNVPGKTIDSLYALGINDDPSVMLNALSFPADTTLANELVSSYLQRKNMIIHPTFSTDTIPLVKWIASIKKRGMHVWLNALWPEHNAGHDDDVAVELDQPDQTWGWLIKTGATIIQTDRPQELKDFLIRKNLHPKF